MILLELIIVTLYTIAVFVIFMYALIQFNLLISYLKAKKKKEESPQFDFSDPTEIPVVTIQLPVYNELYVMERLLENISKIQYPREKLEIQVLDDSTDESVHLTASLIKNLQKTGLDIQHIRRENREGFKAGALKEGLKSAKGEYVAIFDADFLPQPEWLYQTVPYFKDEKIGVVQTSWGHINRDYSTLTQVQAFALDAHFSIEQVGRNTEGHFINFNGTAGIWRKECILDAGNWQGDTLTEDLDLSYRAQLKNWKFKYLEEVKTPAELPIVMSAAKSQQFRWNKGGAQTFQKMIKQVLFAKGIPLKTKIHGLIHLLNSSVFLIIFMLAILSIPMLYIKNKYGSLKPYFTVTSFFISSSLFFFISYWIVYRKTYGKTVKAFANYIRSFITFFSIAMGFSLYNTIAVLEGHFGKPSEFVRTPKFNLNGSEKVKKNKYVNKSIPLHVIFEGLLLIYFIFGLVSAFTVGDKSGDFGFLPLHLMLVFGYGYVFSKSVFVKL